MFDRPDPPGLTELRARPLSQRTRHAPAPEHAPSQRAAPRRPGAAAVPGRRGSRASKAGVLAGVHCSRY